VCRRKPPAAFNTQHYQELLQDKSTDGTCFLLLLRRVTFLVREFPAVRFEILSLLCRSKREWVKYSLYFFYRCIVLTDPDVYRRSCLKGGHRERWSCFVTRSSFLGFFEDSHPPAEDFVLQVVDVKSALVYSFPSLPLLPVLF